MPYPYGMQNAPVVGNGLGGLPRRTTTVPATSNAGRRYTLQTIATSNYSFGTSFQPSIMSPVIMNNGVITRFYLDNNLNQIHKWTCTYSSAGLGTATDTNLNTATWDNTMLPQGGSPKFINFCWKKTISPTYNLYFYTGPILPFWVDSSFATPVYYYPTATSTGTYINGDGAYSGMSINSRSAIIGKNGNLLVLGTEPTNSQLAILEFNVNDTSQVRVAWTGLTVGASGALSATKIRTHSFGYSIAVMHPTAGGATEANFKLATMTNDLARIATRSAQTYEPATTGNPRYVTIELGDTSAFGLFSFGNDARTIYTKRMIMNISSTGALSGDSGGNTMPNFTLQGPSQKFVCPNYPFDSTLSAANAGVVTNIDGTGHDLFIEYGSQANGNALFGIENQILANLIHYDITPPQWTSATTGRICYSNLLAYEQISMFTSNTFAAGVAQDNDGFVFVDNCYGLSGNILLKKVYL